jgi:hypothetical protein
MEQIFQTGRRDARELAIVAMRGAYDEYVAIGRRWRAGAALFDFVNAPHGRDLMP